MYLRVYQTDRLGRTGRSNSSREENRRLKETKKRILAGLERRMQAMKFGYTFLVRGENGSVQDAELQPFPTLEACGEAALKVAGETTRPGKVEIVPCHYDEDGCYPQMIAVVMSFKCGAPGSPEG
jgi:hypothetical protein